MKPRRLVLPFLNSFYGNSGTRFPKIVGIVYTKALQTSVSLVLHTGLLPSPLISDALLFGRLCYGEPDAASNAVSYAKFFSRSHNAVVRVYDDAGNVIEAHEHTGDSKFDDSCSGNGSREVRPRVKAPEARNGQEQRAPGDANTRRVSRRRRKKRISRRR
jgi:hypothetical protein